MHVLSRFRTSQFGAQIYKRVYWLAVFVGIVVSAIFILGYSVQVKKPVSVADTVSAPPLVSPLVSEIASHIEPIVRVGKGESHVLFGWSVAIFGDTVVVGSPGRLGAHNFHDGAAYVFTRLPNGLWRNHTMLQVPDVLTENHDLYGYSVAVHDQAIVVGAKGSARAYVYTRRADGTWFSEPVVEFGHYGDYNNGSVAISSDTIVVGTYGGAYVYNRVGEIWNIVPVAKLRVAFEGIADVKVAVSGDTIALSNPEAGADGRGVVHLYMRTENVWSVEPVQTLVGPSANSAFGSELALHQSSLAVSSYDGAVYVFEQTVEGWSDSGLRLDPPLRGDAFFGRSLCLSDDILAVGTMNYDELMGIVYVYPHVNGEWHLVPSQQLISPELTSSFGHVLACDSSSVVIGEPNGKSRRGSTYIYDY